MRTKPGATWGRTTPDAIPPAERASQSEVFSREEANSPKETEDEKIPSQHDHRRNVNCLPCCCECSVRSRHRRSDRRRHRGGGWRSGGLTDANRPKFRQYVTTQKRRSYKYKEKVVVGAKLPSSGVTYYEVPQEYGVTKYRYTVVNEQPVLVDPGTHTIVQVID